MVTRFWIRSSICDWSTCRLIVERWEERRVCVSDCGSYVHACQLRTCRATMWLMGSPRRLVDDHAVDSCLFVYLIKSATSVVFPFTFGMSSSGLFVCERYGLLICCWCTISTKSHMYETSWMVLMNLWYVAWIDRLWRVVMGRTYVMCCWSVVIGRWVCGQYG